MTYGHFIIKNFNKIINSKYEDLTYFKIKYNNKDDEQIFSIKECLGSGSSGNVYLIKNKMNIYYSIKISYIDTKEQLCIEIENLLLYLKKYNFTINQKPLYYGLLNNKYCCIIYPFLGYYNLKNHNYNLTLLDINNILEQIIIQIKNLHDMIHCDIKSDNIVINYINNNYIANIIDFGLLNHITDINIVSTPFITSPESLLSCDNYKIENYNLSLDKHDYYGLASIIIDLYSKKSYWNILYNYLINYCKLKKYLKYSYIYVYIYFKFYYESKEQLNNINLYKLIEKIEIECNYLLDKKYLLFNDYFNLYIKPNLKYNIDENYLYNLMHFDTNKRMHKNDLLNFLN
jgi:hypothetical protein